MAVIGRERHKSLAGTGRREGPAEVAKGDVGGDVVFCLEKKNLFIVFLPERLSVQPQKYDEKML